MFSPNEAKNFLNVLNHKHRGQSVNLGMKSGTSEFEDKKRGLTLDMDLLKQKSLVTYNENALSPGTPNTGNPFAKKVEQII